MKWNIITDSSCDLFDLEIPNDEISFSSIPFVISVDNRDFVDNTNLNVGEMVAAMEQCDEISHTSCPAPYAWYEQFEKPGYSIAITISSKLSGSYNSACTARNMVLEKLEQHMRHTHIVFALSSFNNLVKNGRMNSSGRLPQGRYTLGSIRRPSY